MNISSQEKSIIKEVCHKWDQLNHDIKKFKRWLNKNKWDNLNKNNKNGMFKKVYSKENLVVKFDEDGEHVFSEYYEWKKASKKKRGFICPTLKFYDGLLFQVKLLDCNRDISEVPNDIHKIAKKFRFSHYWNYGFLNGKVKFYDIDSMYYELTDPEEFPY